MVDGSRDGQEYTAGETFKRYCFRAINPAVDQTCGKNGIWTPSFSCDYSKKMFNTVIRLLILIYCSVLVI